MLRTLHIVSVSLLAFACFPAAAQDRVPRPAETLLYGKAVAPETPNGAVRLAAYNVLNLFDPVNDPDLDHDSEVPKPNSELEAVAAAIRAVDADILALQEVESREALIWFRDNYLEGMGYDHVASLDVGYFRGIENSVLSRYPITDTKVWPNMRLEGEHPELWNGRPNRYAGQPLEYRRSPLRADIEIDDDYTLRLYVVHHKSGRGNDYWREAESEGLISILEQDQQQDEDINIAVLGDFNAQPSDLSVRNYLRAGMVDTLNFRERHCETSAPQYITHESNRTIDFIMVNSGLLREVIPGSSFVYATPARPEGHDWRTDPTPKGYASDHYPVVVDLIPQER
jgi:endonuclease/exonuclease/phosphatase family metal-dependent hydrolase